jgi:hypothetical protein
MGLKVTEPIGFKEWCNGLNGWQAFTLTSLKLPQARADGAFTQGSSTSIYSFGNDSYDFGDPQQDETLAFFYLVYRRKCRQAGFTPSEYEDPSPNIDTDEVPEVPSR